MTSQSVEEMKEMWNDIAVWYERANMITTTRILHSFIEIPDYSSIDKILETGCGPGNSIDKILARAKPTAELVCTDLSEAMIAKASAKNFPRTTCLAVDNQCLPFESDEFDLYLSNMCLNLVPEPMRTLREAYRVTKTGSLSIFSMVGIRGKNPFHDIINDTFAEVNFVPEMRSFTHISDHNKLRKMCKEAGFSKVFTYDSRVPLYPLDTDTIMEFYMRYPHLFELKNTEKYEEVLGIVREKVASRFDSGQLIDDGFIVCIAVK